MLRVLVRAEVGEDTGCAFCPLDVACHQLDGSEEGTDVELVIGADGSQRGEVSSRYDTMWVGQKGRVWWKARTCSS